MAHNILYRSYKDTTSTATIESILNEEISHETWREGGSGLTQPIRWITNKIFDSYEEAEQFIKENDDGWYDQLAVRYREIPSKCLEPSQTYLKLKERSERLRVRYNELSNKIHYKDVKSSFISCRECDSKINSSYFGTRVNNKCPICGNDLRPESTLELIETAKKNYQKAQKEFESEHKKLSDKQKNKAVTYWLVKIEYHT